MHSKIPLTITMSAALILSACFDLERRNNRNEGAGDPGGDDNAVTNHLPSIVGSPPASIREGEAYDFLPTASDPDGDALEFEIARKPAWATFDKVTGRLSGTPGSADVGNYTNIGISVTDGKATAELPNFNVTVDQIAFGIATLSWMPPSENADGSPLTDLAGYRIYYGRNASNLSKSVAIGNPGLTRYVVENLSPAKWYFSMTSLNSKGIESKRTPTATKTVS